MTKRIATLSKQLYTSIIIKQKKNSLNYVYTIYLSKLIEMLYRKKNRTNTNHIQYTIQLKYVVYNLDFRSTIDLPHCKIHYHYHIYLVWATQ